MYQRSCIEFCDIHHTILEGGIPKTVLTNVSGIWNEGCAIALRGISGSGKTTLLSIIAGMRAPTSGTLLYNGTPCYGTNIEDGSTQTGKIGYVFQEALLIPSFRVWENVALKGLILGVDQKELYQQALELLSLV